jgi:hypothetical protein
LISLSLSPCRRGGFYRHYHQHRRHANLYHHVWGVLCRHMRWLEIRWDQSHKNV